MGKRIDRKVRAVLRRVFLVTVLIAGQTAAGMMTHEDVKAAERLSGKDGQATEGSSGMDGQAGDMRWTWSYRAEAGRRAWNLRHC